MIQEKIDPVQRRQLQECRERGEILTDRLDLLMRSRLLNRENAAQPEPMQIPYGMNFISPA